ncbi:MAG: response regulator [Acidobacteria bacterium]|nr:response regulator [Acidobacteriota bacterium]
MHVLSFEKRFFEIPPTDRFPLVFGAAKEDRNQTPRLRTKDENHFDEKRRRNRVLIVGRMRELALYRAEVLRQAGFEVRTPENEEEAIAIVKGGDFDVAVFSYTLPSETVQEMAELVREHCSDCPIVAIAETNRVDRRIAPDAIALAADGPPGLLGALRRVVKQR